jgi:hypothetical protein
MANRVFRGGHEEIRQRAGRKGEYALTNDRHPKTVYVREDVVLNTVHPWLERMFDADHIDGTVTALVAAIEDGADDEEEASRRQAARAAVAQCDARLESYKRALEEGGDPTLIGQWIREASAERAVAMRAAAGARPGRSSLSASEKLRPWWTMCGPLRAL